MVVISILDSFPSYSIMNTYDLSRNTNVEGVNDRLGSVLFKVLILIGSCLEILGEDEAMNNITGIMNDYKESTNRRS